MRKLNHLHMGVMLAVVMLAGVRLAAAQAIEFPIHANDLNPGERIVTVVHATGGGPQTGAKDLRILRHVADNDWQVLKDGKTDESVNSNYLIYKRPVYAMASGTVVACWRNAPENTGHSQRPEVLGSKKIYLQGNHLWIKQTDGRYVLYAHAPTGDIPASLCPHNGTFLTGTAGRPDLDEPGQPCQRRYRHRWAVALSRRQQRQLVGAAPAHPHGQRIEYVAANEVRPRPDDAVQQQHGQPQRALDPTEWQRTADGDDPCLATAPDW